MWICRRRFVKKKIVKQLLLLVFERRYQRAYLFNEISKRKIKVEKMNNKDIQNIAIAMLESIKIKYKALRELEKLNQEKGIFNSDLSLYLEYLRETDGLKFDDEGNLIE